MKDLNGTKKTAIMGLLAAIIILLVFTPVGFINLPFIKATAVHVPVIIGSVLLGYKRGALLGLLFGAASLMVNTAVPSISSFAFSPLIPLPGSDRGSAAALAVCFVPRILVGVVPYFVYTGLMKLNSKLKSVWLAVSGISGAFTNTLLVMHFIFLFFKDSYAEVRNVAADAVYSVILGIIAANGTAEALLAAVLTFSICQAVFMYQHKRG